MKPYQALIWNEWRQMRGMFMAAAGAMVLLYLTLLILTMLRVHDIYSVAGLTFFVLPGLLACIGFGAFQSELKSQTDSFLLSLPVSRGKIFWYKYLFNLSLYFILTVLCCSLFIPLSFEGNPSFSVDSFINSPSIIFFTMYLSVHGMTFTAPLLQNSRGGKAGGWALALAFPAMVIGIQAIVALCTRSELRWVGIVMFIIAAVLWLAALGLGYYLWTNYLAFKRNLMRPLFAAAGITVLFSAILFTTAYINSGLDLASARRAARAAGLELEPAPPLTPEAKADASRLQDSMQQYQSRLDAVKPKLPSQSWINDDKYSWLFGDDEPQLPLETMQQAATFILNEPKAIRFYTDLVQVLNKPDCRFSDTCLTQRLKLPGRNSDKDLTGIAVIMNFLYDRAYALELGGRTPEAFECLELMDKLGNAVDKYRSFHRDYTYWIKVGVSIGPDTMAGVKYYEKMLQQLSSMRPQFNDDTRVWLKYFDATFGIPQGPLRSFLESGAFLLSPRYRESIANFLRWQVAYKQLFEQAKMAKYTEIYPVILKFDQIAPAIITTSSVYQIKGCYAPRIRIATMQLYLALKIYRAKYGSFPDTLAKLAPEILPVVPLNPVTGENFGYHAAADGFSMEIESVDSSISTYSYHTWNKNPDSAVRAAAKAEAEAKAQVRPSPRNKRRGAPFPVLTNSKEKIK